MAILTSSQVKMTSVLEKIVAIIAPHRCIVCSNYNNVMCDSCVQEMPRIKKAICVLCGDKSVDWQICSSCASHTALTRVYVSGLYQSDLKELVHRYKFDHARAAHVPLALAISNVLPSLKKDWVVVPVPTVAQHARQRSYDHARLLAKQLAKQQGLGFAELLVRTKNVRQVGANRRDRAGVAETIELRKPGKYPVKILLIDDVCTTGATLSACAKILKDAGALEVRAAVAAWQPHAPDTKKDR